MSDKLNLPRLPRRTVKYVTDPGEMSEAGVRGMLSNPVYAGVPPYQRIVSDEAWIQSAAQLIEDEGVEQFLVNMLYMLRNSMVDVVPDEAIPADYDGPWPEEDEDEENLSFPANSSDPSSPWLYPLEGLIFCSHDGLPMIILDNEFLCVGEYLYAHLEDAPITDLITEPVLTLVFQNGHTLPLLCPDCGQSFHTDDCNELLDTLNGLIITNIEWDYDTQELVISFGKPEEVESEEEPAEILSIHLNSVRELTCPGQQEWPDNEEM
ncbi:MAG: hypothetical protein JW953_10200 [Anaerolineae bacterium]|nr:hypothetical protein [Anaerolineae bacterium]